MNRSAAGPAAPPRPWPTAIPGSGLRAWFARHPDSPVGSAVALEPAPPVGATDPIGSPVDRAGGQARPPAARPLVGAGSPRPGRSLAVEPAAPLRPWQTAIAGSGPPACPARRPSSPVAPGVCFLTLPGPVATG